MLEIYCKVTARGLAPMFGSDYDAKRKLKEGEEVLCTIRRPRNYKFHKKFFALLRVTFHNMQDSVAEQYGIRNEHDLLDCIKIELQMYDVIRIGGSNVIRLGSISFAEMDETEFEEFYSRAVDIILARYLKGTDREELIQAIEDFK